MFYVAPLGGADEPQIERRKGQWQNQLLKASGGFMAQKLLTQQTSQFVMFCPHR